MANTADQPSTFRWTEHISLIVSFSLTIFVVVRVASLCRWRPTTIVAVFRESATSTILLASALGLVSIVTPLIAAVVWVGWRMTPLGLIGRSRWVGVLSFAVSCFVSPALVVLIFAVFAILLTDGRRRNRAKYTNRRAAEAASEARPLEQIERVTLLAGLLAMFLSLAAVLLLFGQLRWNPWMPAEVLTTTKGRKSVVLVLSESSDELVVMDEPNRLVRRYRVSQVADRRICETESDRQLRPLPEIIDDLGGRSSYGRRPKK